MANSKSVIQYLLAIIVAVTLFSQPADARRIRFFGIPSFGGGESIDPVYDLPDREPFIKEGDFMDVGWLNGRTSSSYVLYHGDRYVRLDDGDIAALTGVLGFDPTAAHKAKQAPARARQEAENKAELDHKNALIASGRLLERRDGETDSEYAIRKNEFLAKARTSRSSAVQGNSMPEKSSGSSGHIGFVTVVLIFLGLFGIGKKLFAKFSSSETSEDAAPIFKARNEPEPDGPEDGPDTTSFDAKIASRLAQLQSGNPAASAGTTQAQPPQRGGFGRKGLASSGSLG